MKPLSKSQQKVYDYILSCSEEGRVPSVRELCEATGFKSTSTVHLHLRTLEERGLIERESGLNRCIRIKNDEPTSKVPLLGRVTAGVPILAVEEIESYVPVAQSVTRGREMFALTVWTATSSLCTVHRLHSTEISLSLWSRTSVPAKHRLL